MAEFSRRQQQKRSTRRERVRQQRDHRRRVHACRDAYPRWAVHPGEAPPGVVRRVEQAVGRIQFDGPQFVSAERDLLRAVKRGAFDRPWGADELPLLGRDHQPAVVKLLYRIGTLLFSVIPEAELEELLIDNDVRVEAQGDRLVAVCSSLRRWEGSSGTAYHSPHRPTIVAGDGVRRVVGFTREAVRRVYDLLVPCWRTYVGHGDAFETVRDCIHYEPCRLPGGQEAFTFYQECRPGNWGHAYARAVLGPGAVDPLRLYALRLGYCPVVADGGFAVATTFLCPGHEGTPEQALLGTAAADQHQDRDALTRSALRTSTLYLQRTGDFSAVRWFHGHGVPQVLPIERPLYEPYVAGGAGLRYDVGVG